MESDGDHFLAYYLTPTDEAAVSFNASRSNPPKPISTNGKLLAFLDSEAKHEEDADADPNAIAFHFVRDYETVKVEQEVPNEFLLVLDDGGGGGVVDGDTKVDAKLAGQDIAGGIEKRRKGAYYKNIERKMILKKKRVNVRPLFYFIL
jgi:RNA polymerase II-associated factor 1